MAARSRYTLRAPGNRSSFCLSGDRNLSVPQSCLRHLLKGSRILILQIHSFQLSTNSCFTRLTSLCKLLFYACRFLYSGQCSKYLQRERFFFFLSRGIALSLHKPVQSPLRRPLHCALCNSYDTQKEKFLNPHTYMLSL